MRRHWWWPRLLVTRNGWSLWFAPTFFGFGAAVYPSRTESPWDCTLSIGVFPFTLTWEKAHA